MWVDLVLCWFHPMNNRYGRGAISNVENFVMAWRSHVRSNFSTARLSIASRNAQRPSSKLNTFSHVLAAAVTCCGTDQASCFRKLFPSLFCWIFASSYRWSLGRSTVKWNLQNLRALQCRDAFIHRRQRLVLRCTAYVSLGNLKSCSFCRA